MKHLLITTAMVAFTALPVTAQTTDNTGSGAASQSVQGRTSVENYVQGQIDLRENVAASDLIGKRIFMSRQAARQQAQDNDQTGSQIGTDTRTGNVTGGMNDTQVAPQAGQVPPPVEGETDALPGTEQDLATETQFDQAGNGASGTRNDRPRMVGVIRDVILNAEGDAVGLVVDAGGYLGLAADEIRLPMQYISLVPDEALGLHQSGQQDGAGAQDPVAFSAVYIGNPAAFQLSENFDDAQATAVGETRGSDNWGQLEQDWQEASFSDVTADELLGAPVYGSKNEWIAEVSALPLDQSSEIRNIIIDVGGFLETGTKPVALQVQDVQLRVYGGSELRVHIPYTEDQLANMETWEGDSDL